MAIKSSVQKPHFDMCFLDLNTASEEEIGSVPLIGPVRARELVEHRPFKNMDDVRRVPGIFGEQLNALIQAGAVVNTSTYELRV